MDEAGNPHETKKAAERADAIAATVEEFEAARRKVVTLLLADAKTGDGLPFDAMKSQNYWRVRDICYSMPRLERFQFYCWQSRIEVSCGRGLVELLEYNSSDQKFHHVPITELYHDKTKAIIAWGEAVEQWFREQREGYESELKERAKR